MKITQTESRMMIARGWGEGRMRVWCYQLCPTLCDPMDCSPPGSSVHWILQARILEWIAVSSSKDLPDAGIEPVSPALLDKSLPLRHLGSIYSSRERLGKL